MKPKIVLLVGESGSGKSRVASELAKRGWKELYSYTTRPKRNEEDKKTFVSQTLFDQLKPNMIAYTKFDGHDYGTTKQQIEEHDLYIIDPPGIDYMMKHYDRDQLIVIFLDAIENVRFYRLVHDRGEKEARRRIEHDREVFREFREQKKYDMSIVNNEPLELEWAIDTMDCLMKSWLRKGELHEETELSSQG